MIEYDEISLGIKNRSEIMTEQQQATLHAALLAIDDPYYLNTFQDAEDEVGMVAA